ncbi:PepSY domain-containing protein [Olivibacter ginsenosidimutans]|uniref:PepSY domain-containing protein n=1 Tax=Olivibacter ginsenosidimutans TaxID=1176537 RepID=UPI003CD067B9
MAAHIKKGSKNKSWFTKTIAWLHLWPSLASALVLIFVCLTGTIVVYNDEVIALSAGQAKYVRQVMLDNNVSKSPAICLVMIQSDLYYLCFDGF